jgi:hypothetical protein
LYVVPIDREVFRVPLEGYVMQLRRLELESVAAALGEFDTSEGNLIRLAEALRTLPPSDRAPLWELAVRHYGRHKPLEQSAGEIGMDALRARQLLQIFSEALSTVPPPEDAAAR